MFLKDTDTIYQDDPLSMFRELNLFSSAATFKVLIQNNVGNNELNMSKIIPQDSQESFFEFLDAIEETIGIINGIDYSFDFICEYDSGRIFPCLIIHYPKLTISMISNPDVTHEIKDLYLVLKMERVSDTNKWIFNASPCAFKETFSLKEAQSNYIHSHVEEYRDYSKIRKFCIGQSEIPQLLFDVIHNEDCYNKIALEAYFMFLDSIVHTESTVGVPYKKILSIGLKNSASTAEPSITHYYILGMFTHNKERFKMFHDFYLTNIKIDENIEPVIINEQLFRDGLLNFCKKYEETLLCHNNGENVVFYTSVANNDHHIEEDTFVYRGAKHTVTVKGEEEEDNQTSLNGYFIKGSIEQKIRDTLKLTINNELKKKYYAISN